METIGSQTIDLYTAFKESAQWQLRNCPVEQEKYWQARIASYTAVIEAVETCLRLEAAPRPEPNYA